MTVVKTVTQKVVERTIEIDGVECTIKRDEMTGEVTCMHSRTNDDTTKTFFSFRFNIASGLFKSDNITNAQTAADFSFYQGVKAEILTFNSEYDEQY